MTDLKIVLEKVDDICEKFELEDLHTHPTYKQFKRLFTELNKIAEPVQLVSYATDMTTCTLTNGDGNGYFYNRVDPEQPATYTAVDMTTAAAQGFRDGRKLVGLLLGKGFNTLNQVGGKYSIVLAFQNSDDAYAAYTEIATIVRLAGEA